MKIRFLLLASFFVFIFVVATSIFNRAMSDESGAPAGVTGSPRDGTSCISCHTPAINFKGAGSVTSTIPSDGYTAGQTYTITAGIIRQGHVRFGFEVSPQDTTTAGNYVGSMTVTNSTTTQLMRSNYITHTSNGTTGTNSDSWSFNWTAPATGKGPAVFYAAFNASNDNGQSSGDSIFLTSYKVYECFPPVQPGTITGNSSVCAGSSLTYSVTAVTGATSYNWSLPSGWTGTSTTTSITVTAGSSGGTISVTATNGCGTSIASTQAVTVTSAGAASVSISTEKDTVCNGASVTFTATPTNGGTSPVYQWKLNSADVGSNAATYSNSALVTGDIITCVLTSDLACVTQSPATSNSIIMTVESVLPVSVSIATAKDTVCSGSTANFTATPTNGGTAPTYQWKLNGNDVGTNSSAYSNSALVNGNTISCVLTSNLACVTGSPATSNSIGMTINPDLPVSVSVASSQDTICSGTQVNFTASPTNGGTVPAYQWKLNGSDVGTNSPTYSNSALANGNIISCVLTSNLACASQNPATSNSISIMVNPLLPVSVSILASGDTICSGTPVNFTAVPVNGGTAPVYHWQINGSDAGTNSSVFSDSTLVNGDRVTCMLTSNLACVTQNPASSNLISIAVNPIISASVSITGSDTNICAGQPVNFTANPVNGGAAPVYQWKKNGGIIAGQTSGIYTSAGLANGDLISLTMNSSATCPSPAKAVSNIIEMQVNPVLIPSVSISSNSGNSICANQQVTFNSAIINGGTAPELQWYKNGSLLSGQVSSTYTSSAFSDGDSVTLSMISNATCASPDTVTSNSVIIHIVNNAIPSVTISSNSTDSICPGQNVVFTAQPVNGGTSPGYQWLKNGIPLTGDTVSTYSTNTIIDGDSISVNLISNSSCVVTQFASSNSIKFTVIPFVSPTLSVSPDTGYIVCQGVPVAFSSSATNQGSSPAYQWLKNGSIISGESSSAYTDSFPANNDSISVVMTSDRVCVSPATVTAGPVVTHVLENVTPSVIISANPAGAICQGQSIVLSAQPTNGGTDPAFQWFKNSTALLGETLPSYTDSFPADSDVILLTMISNGMCVSPGIAVSNLIITNVLNKAIPSVTIQSNASDTICTGQNVSFTPVPVDGGTNPSYQWKINGIPLTGDTMNIYNTSSLINGDTVSVDMVSDYVCLITPFASSAGIIKNVIPLVSPTIRINPDSGFAICPGQEVLFTASATNQGNSPVYQWQNKGENISSENSSSYLVPNLSNGDVISCLLVSSAQCASPGTVFSAGDTIQIYPVAQASIVQDNDTLMATPGTAYQWFLNNNIISGAVNQIFVASSNGNYNVQVTDAHGCTSLSDTLNVTSLGIITSSRSGGISVYPNPTDGVFYIVRASMTSSAILRLYDINGRLILEDDIASSNLQNIKLDIHTLDSGIYLLNIQDDKNNYNTRLVKE